MSPSYVLFADSKLWHVIEANSNGRLTRIDSQWDSPFEEEREPFIYLARSIAYEQGYVESDGYYLTPLGKAWTKLLDTQT